MPKSKAVVLISGGMDSLVCTALASRDHEVLGLHLNYGQRTERRERKAFKDICHYYGIKQCLEIDVSFLNKIGGSALTDPKIPVPDSEISGIPVTYVPFRNTHLIAMAVSWAEIQGAEKIFIGAVEEDGSGYPDCRAGYFKAYENLIRIGTKPETRISLQTPLISLTKAQIVQKGHELKAPFRLSWSCYRNSRKACGICASCRLRLKGFHEAGLVDPLPYKVHF